mmetsp:Transcript_10098/g.16635  ORF Transcript_10098/g.16635 Transcript_10098/m.16635 type:complete len:163 (-) Transcript_10098:418-906(-)
MLTQCSRRSATHAYHGGSMNKLMHKIRLHKLGHKRPLSSSPAPSTKCVPDVEENNKSVHAKTVPQENNNNNNNSKPMQAKVDVAPVAPAASPEKQPQQKKERPSVKFAPAVEVPQETASESKEESRSVQFNQRVKVFVYKLSDEELTWKRENNATRQELAVH